MHPMEPTSEKVLREPPNCLGWAFRGVVGTTVRSQDRTMSPL